jgi:hypothetical protein
MRENLVRALVAVAVLCAPAAAAHQRTGFSVYGAAGAGGEVALAMSNANVRCPAVSTCDGLGYRDGLCQQCDCCPRCWSCVELHYYNCAARNGITVTASVSRHPAVSVGEAMQWDVAQAEAIPALVPPVALDANANTVAHTTNASAADPAPAPVRKGWRQCAAAAAGLPPGLSLSDSGRLEGVLRYDRNRPPAYSCSVTLINAAAWDTTHGVRQIEIRFAVDGNVPANDGGGEAVGAAEARRQERGDRGALAAAKQAANAVLGAYGGWARGSMSHPDVVAQMKGKAGEGRLC